LDNESQVFQEPNTASTTLQVDGDFYFDNDNILHPFEKFFKLLLFKKGYENHALVCLIDNARTHIEADLSLYDFGMKPGTRCPIDHID
jgi:hypothetical protein